MTPTPPAAPQALDVNLPLPQLPSQPSAQPSSAMDALLELLGAPVSTEQRQLAVDMVRRVVQTGTCGEDAG